MRREAAQAIEIDGDDAAWLRGVELPDGVEIESVDEVEFWGATYECTESGLYVPAHEDASARVLARKMRELHDQAIASQPVGISLFTGAGGFDLGMHEAGIDVVAANEWDVSAATTYLLNLARPDCDVRFVTEQDRHRWEKGMKKQAKRKNRLPDEWMGSGYRESRNMHSGCRAFFLGDVSKLTGAQMMEAAGVDHVHVVFGGPPCQGLSTANSKACLEDPRNGLLWEFLRLVAEIQPDSFIIENVPTLLTVAKGALFNAIAQLANEAGYDVVATKLNAAEYGVPQYRLRAIIVGSREGSRGYCYPMPSTWAVGRPVHDKGWAIGHEDQVPQQKRLPPQAHYDRDSRRWSFYDGDEKPLSSPVARDDDPQLDWMEAAD